MLRIRAEFPRCLTRAVLVLKLSVRILRKVPGIQGVEAFFEPEPVCLHVLASRSLGPRLRFRFRTFGPRVPC